MSPAEYLEEVVVPTVREFRDERRSRQRAYLSCIVVFHIKDHLKGTSESSIENTLRAACSTEFDVVRGICNGTKHVQTDSTHPIPFATGDDWDRPPARLGEMVLGVSRLGDAKGGREIGSGQNRLDIYSSVKTVLEAFKKCYPSHLGSCEIQDC